MVVLIFYVVFGHFHLDCNDVIKLTLPVLRLMILFVLMPQGNDLQQVLTLLTCVTSAKVQILTAYQYKSTNTDAEAILQILDSQGYLSEEQTCTIGIAVLHALVTAHAAGIYIIYNLRFIIYHVKHMMYMSWMRLSWRPQTTDRL